MTKSYLSLVEMEVRELLSEYEYPGDDLPVIQGSALGALNGEKQWEDKIVELAEALDSYIPLPERALLIHRSYFLLKMYSQSKVVVLLLLVVSSAVSYV